MSRNLSINFFCMLSYEFERPTLSVLKNRKIKFEVLSAQVRNANLHPRDNKIRGGDLMTTL